MASYTFPEEEYHIPFFDEEGFKRKQCKVCGEYFWTQLDEQDTCGESPCQPYEFIGNPPTEKGYSLREMRECFLSFFERKGHKRIKRYPIVARWRDDLYFTDASIVDFQPYVTEGISPPPANPLVIVQPCIRLVDIDNVGLTFGRHMTIFEMGGAHAFNYPDKEIYWKDETVRLHHEFVTKELKIRSEEITYKEGVWSGGGNAGPDLESAIRGLEVATLVFMNYKVTDEGLIKLPVRTVDTGYGIERYTWLSQGSISCFDAIYKPILDKLIQITGVELDESLLKKYSIYTGEMRLGKVPDITKLRKGVAEKIGIDVTYLHSKLTSIENIYAALDHSKCIAFMLSEGIVPSNAREGYLARLVIRRLCNILDKLGIGDRLLDLVEWQIEFWSHDYPELREMRNEIMDILATEERKYRSTLSRGIEVVRRTCLNLKAKNINEIPLDKLIEFYDSHGIPVSIVSDVAKKEGVKAEFPDDFYSRVALRHLKAEVKPKEFEWMKEKVLGLPETKLLFYEDPYMKKFEAEVLKVIGDRYVVLDRTAFYPEGGGQPSDQGFMEWNGVKSFVKDVKKIDGVVVHEVEGTIPKEKTRIIGEIDWERRMSLMKHHTATHILIGAFRRVLGEHVWQAGAQKGEQKSRLDISHHKRISEEEANRAEALANSIVMQDIPVEILTMPREEVERMFGFRIYQGGVVPTREIRIVKIGDWDVEACGGTHCRRTGEVGLIKIENISRIQDGVERIEFSAGMPAVIFTQRREGLLRKLAEKCGTSIEGLEREVDKLRSAWKEARKEAEKLRKSLIRYEATELIKKAIRIGEIRAIFDIREKVDVKHLISLSEHLVKMDPELVVVLLSMDKNVQIVGMAGNSAVSKGINMGKIVCEASEIVGGGGGGRAEFGQGGGPLLKEVNNALERAREIIEQLFNP